MVKTESILVTGGAGFIGSHIVDRLIEKRFNVIVLDDLSSGYRENINPKAHFYKADITNAKKLESIFRKEMPTYVVHAAANIKVSHSVKNPIYDAKTNIIGGINVIKCSKQNNVKKIIYLSTGGALYGNPEYLPVDEHHQIKPISPYGVSKYAIELYLYSYFINFNMNFVTLRFSNVYGPRDRIKSDHVIPSFIYKLLNKKSPIITGDGNQGRDFIYVEDVVSAVMLSLKRKTKDKVFNIGTEKLISINELFYEVKNILKVNVEPKYVEKRKGDVKEVYLNAKRAKEHLGWKPVTDLQSGLKATIKWFKEK